MTDTKSIVDETTDGLRVILGRLGEFFHILDLSFFIAGTASFGALFFLIQQLGIKITFPFAPWVAGFTLVITCYICGLLSFSLGRWINGGLFRRNVLKEFLESSIKMHQLYNLNDPVIQSYLVDKDKGLWRLYIRFWQDLANKQSRSIIYYHLSRYWVMAATFDGLAISLILWTVAIGISTFHTIPTLLHLLSIPQGIIAIVVFLTLALLSFRQGGKFLEFQVEDLIAALAVTN
jgi:hypothetical protein